MNTLHTAWADCPLAATLAPAWRGLVQETLQLPDGRLVTLRPVRAGDADAAAAFFSALSPRTRLLRFHGAVNRLPTRVLHAMTAVDQQQHVALVAEVCSDDGACRIVADARYVVDAAGDAEFAVVVDDDWRRMGLARALLARLGRHARQRGLNALHGSVTAGNEPMLAFMRELGAGLRFDPEDASTVQVDLPR